MDQRVSDQLEKVLALADSSHDGEAIIAVRKARQMLSRDGLSFGDLARAVKPRFSGAFSLFSGHHVHLETEVVRLRQQLQDLQAEMQTQTLQLEFWHRRANELQQNLNLSQSEVERWRQLARETAEKLWATGQTENPEEVTLKAEPKEP